MDKGGTVCSDLSDGAAENPRSASGRAAAEEPACGQQEVRGAEPAACGAGSQSDSDSAAQGVARFKHLYSSKGGSLCLYEDADGHLIAVDSSRFA